MNGLVSIVMPCYNAEKYITETVSSVVNQTYNDWELIIVNDGSTDNSLNMIKEFAASDNRISFIDKKNTGVSDTRNCGIELCKGEYIAFLDADDTWELTNLEDKIALLSRKEVDFGYSDMTLVDENSKSLNIITTGTDIGDLNQYLLWETTVIPAPCSNIIIKRKCLANGLRFDPAFSTAADQDFCFTLCKNYIGKRVPKPLWNYRQIGNSMSRNITVMERDHIAVYKKAADKGYFYSFWFKQQCFSNLYLIIAGSWWKNGNNKLRGLYFIWLSVINYPPQLFNVLKKMF